MATLVSRINDLAGAVRNKFNQVMPRLVPPGGGTGQVLTKSSDADHSFEWSDLSVPSGTWAFAPFSMAGSGFADQEITLPNADLLSTDVVVFTYGLHLRPDVDYDVVSGKLTIFESVDATGTIVVRPQLGLQGPRGPKGDPGAGSAITVINTYLGDATASLADMGALVRINSSSANGFTIPNNATVAFPIGSTINLQQTGSGQTSIVAAAGVNTQSDGGLVKIKGQYGAATLIKVDVNTWTILGALVA